MCLLNTNWLGGLVAYGPTNGIRIRGHGFQIQESHCEEELLGCIHNTCRTTTLKIGL